MNYPQDYDTNCLICGKKIFAPVKDFVCNTCHDSEVSTVADFIVKQNAIIAELTYRLAEMKIELEEMKTQ